jgi:IPT/TIG domain
MKWPVSGLMVVLMLSATSTSTEAQYQQQSAPITVAESKLFEAPNNQVQHFSEYINLPKGQDKLNLTLTYYNGTTTKPGFKWLRITSSTMNYFTEQQFGGNKSVSKDVTGELMSGNNQIVVEAGGIAGSTFGWRLTTAAPTLTSIQPQALEPGETIKVSGTNFCSDTSCDIATVNGVTLTCLSATAKNLVFKIPDDLPLGSGALQLKVAGLDAGQTMVNIETSVPVLRSLDSGWVYPGYNLVINGGPFPPTAANIRVTVGPFEAKVVQASATAVTVQAPEQFNGNPWGVNQPVRVWVNGVQARNYLTVNCYQGVNGQGL